MIIERHLRIGNFVARNDSKEFIISEVLGINRNFEWEYLIDSRNSDGRHRESLWISAKKCDPIPLTPEWLERCGFKEEKKGFYVNYNRKDTEGCCLDFLTLRRHEVSAFYELGREHEDYFELYTQNKHKILHLHQLQNLYFALTGEELNVKL